ncbi:phytanoyl-CoA dioxygenase family protein [Novosphingobium sp. FKTRR1]|uniref:phytanoyl-CoA dioxygenase family protein n=1 Tax=Novosphingobium sp. FKTRR1 TaxID=2879118 RepID=UPI001CEFC72D|nr:phytanoyl-CoA dioxygenase family protein [Novosphingobium sp. FKTRR1]
MLGAQIDRWDDSEICGRIVKGTPRRLIIELAGRRLASLETGTGVVEFDHERFRIDTAYFPAACLQDLRITIESDGAALTFSPNGSAQQTNLVPHSPFGGMWIDLPNWDERLAEKMASGEIDADTAAQIRTFVRDGYIVIPGAVAPETVSRLNRDIDDAWDQKYAGIDIEIFTPQSIVPIDRAYYNQNTKLLDAYFHLQSAREAATAPKVVAFLTAVFEDRPKAFQQLSFIWGSQQPIHKDTAYVKVDGNPMSMLATWTALEDIAEGTGELEYFVGSHRSADYVFGSLSKWMEANPSQHEAFLTSLHEDAAKLGQAKSSFLAKAGDVLVWHADLAHGGSAVTRPGHTRKSIVTHFTAEKYNPYYNRQSQSRPHIHNGVVFVSGKGEIKA